MENTPYFTAIIAARSLLVDPEDALEGNTLLSIETCEEEESDVVAYIQTHFAEFLQYLTYLPTKDQDLLLAYHLLRKTQNQLGPLFHLTQTVCSFELRLALQALAAYILFSGHPTQERIEAILAPAGFSVVVLDSYRGKPQPVPLAALIIEYMECRSFTLIADRHNLHRPDIRRKFRRTGEALRESEQPERRALGAWLMLLIDKQSPTGKGYTERHVQKMKDERRTASALCGEFRIRIEDEHFSEVFAPRSSAGS